MVNKCLKMVLVAPNRWDLIAPKGHILVEGIRLYSEDEAHNWTKAYVSSWTGYTFEVIITKTRVK